jgi:hypothetical protein
MYKHVAGASVDESTLESNLFPPCDAKPVGTGGPIDIEPIREFGQCDAVSQGF